MAYTEREIAEAKEEIVEGLHNGKSLQRILFENPMLPRRVTVYAWLNDKHAKFDGPFLADYMRARDESADLDAEKIEDLNRELREGTIDPKAARVIADNLKWTAGKKKPKRYGDKSALEVDLKSVPVIQFQNVSKQYPDPDGEK